jgi:hypothetical protein
MLKMNKCRYLLLAAVVALLSPQFAVATVWAASGAPKTKSCGMGDGCAGSAAYAKIAKESHGKCVEKAPSANSSQNGDCTDGGEASRSINEPGLSVKSNHKGK